MFRDEDAWSRLAGARPTASLGLEYKVRIRRSYRSGSATDSGRYEKDTAEGLKTHAFVRAATQQPDDARAFTITRAKALIVSRATKYWVRLGCSAASNTSYPREHPKAREADIRFVEMW